MLGKARFLYATDDALAGLLGTLENARPELAKVEAVEVERKGDGKPGRRGIELARPVLDEELVEVPETTEAARESAPPAEVDGKDGSDLESPDAEQAALDALFEKYQGNPRSMAKAIRNLRSLQTQTAEDRNELLAKLESVAGVIDSDYDWVDGKPVLKASVAAKQLRSAGSRSAPVGAPSEDDIRMQVQTEFAQHAGEAIDESQLPRFLEIMSPLIEKQVKERVTVTKAQIQSQRFQMLSEVGQVVQRHLTAHPEDKDLLSEIDAVYGGIPEELRSASILEEWLPFEKVADLVRLKSKLPSIVKDAYELGKKHRGNAGTPTESGAPGKSRPGAGTKAGKVDPDREFKDRMMHGSGLPSIDTLFKR